MAAPRISNLETFGVRLNNSVRRLETEFAKEVGRLYKTATIRLVERTPVLTGRARGGWRGSVGKPTAEGGGKRGRTWAEGKANSILDPRGGQTVSTAVNKILQAIKAGGPHQIFWIVNNVPYIGVLEEKGSRRTAPNGIFDITVLELKAELEGR